MLAAWLHSDVRLDDETVGSGCGGGTCGRARAQKRRQSGEVEAGVDSTALGESSGWIDGSTGDKSG